MNKPQKRKAGDKVSVKFATNLLHEPHASELADPDNPKWTTKLLGQVIRVNLTGYCFVKVSALEHPILLWPENVHDLI